MARLGSLHEYPVGSFIETLIAFGREAQSNLELCLKLIVRVFSKPRIPNAAYAQTKALY